ncbi:MAG: hypothetical protein AAB420_01205 [Patescibacteria group bacterium]
MKNKILLAGILLFFGGFMVADAANLNLLARIGSPSASFSKAKTTNACNDAFRVAENTYKTSVRAAKEKRDAAVRAKQVCLKKVSETRKSPTPSPVR